MPNLIPIPGVRQSGTESASVELTEGVYWHIGDTNAAPEIGNYTATLLQDDGSAGDQSTGDTATGVKVIVILHAGSFGTLANWDGTKVFDGTGASSFDYWDGSAWESIADTNATGWTPHGAMAPQRRVATFADENVSNPGTLDYVREKFTSGENGPGSTDSRPAS